MAKRQPAPPAHSCELEDSLRSRVYMTQSRQPQLHREQPDRASPAGAHLPHPGLPRERPSSACGASQPSQAVRKLGVRWLGLSRHQRTQRKAFCGLRVTLRHTDKHTFVYPAFSITPKPLSAQWRPSSPWASNGTHLLSDRVSMPGKCGVEGFVTRL